MDLQFLMFLFPAGVILCFRELRDEHLFVIVYSVMASYFAGVMVRLMLTLTPVVCVASAVALSTVLDTYVNLNEPETPAEDKDVQAAPANSAGSSATTSATPAKKEEKTKKAESGSLLGFITSGFPKFNPKSRGIYGIDTRLTVILNALGLLVFFVHHCTWVTSNAYSSPSVVLSSWNQDGSMHIIDDFREAYYWLRQNTAKDAVIMSWWDYGYQIAGMADRPTLVDNNTWNNSKSSPVSTLTFDSLPLSSAYCHRRKGNGQHRRGRIPYPPQARRRLRARHLWWTYWLFG